MWCPLTSLLSLSLLRLALGCNGNGDFCNLPFAKYTFAGSHNANAYDLVIPELIQEDIPLVDVNEILRGYYENHDLDLTEQLSFGIRAFMVDLCDHADTPGAGPFLNCHGPTGQAAFRGKFEDDLDKVAEWLSLHPRELIVLSPDNIPSRGGTRWEDLMKTKFGGLGTGSSCAEIDGTTDVSSWSARAEVPRKVMDCSVSCSSARECTVSRMTQHPSQSPFSMTDRTGVMCCDQRRPQRQHHDGRTGGSQPAGGGLAGELEGNLLQHL